MNCNEIMSVRDFASKANDTFDFAKRAEGSLDLPFASDDLDSFAKDVTGKSNSKKPADCWASRISLSKGGHDGPGAEIPIRKK